MATTIPNSIQFKLDNIAQVTFSHADSNKCSYFFGQERDKIKYIIFCNVLWVW